MIRMGNVFQRILVFFGFKRTDGQPVQEFTNLSAVPVENSASIHIGKQGKQYSWDKRRAAGNVDHSAWTIKGVTNSNVVRLPGSVSGNDLEVQDCKDSRIYIFDNASQIIVDDCSNCKFIFSAIRGNVFFRNCNGCSAIVATCQFRTRDCSNFNFYLYCQTVPIIEASSEFQFHCFQFSYDGIKQHMSSAGLACFNNNWSTIHDFTPESGRRNYSIISPPYPTLASIFPLDGLDVENLNIDFAVENSCVPSTWGSSLVGESNEAMIVIAPGMTQLSFAHAMSAELSSANTGPKLKQAVLHKISADDASRIFSDNFGTLQPSCFESGNIIALIIAFHIGSSSDILQSMNELVTKCQANFKKLPSYGIFTSKSVIEEMIRFAASQISG